LRENEAMRLVALIALVSASQALFCQPGKTPALSPGVLLTAGCIAKAAFRYLARLQPYANKSWSAPALSAIPVSMAGVMRIVR
jgi:hypothetical protein